MATSLFYQGRLVSVPGAYSVMDVSGLDATGLGASGIVALIAEGEGGIPVSDIETTDDFIRCRSSQSVQNTFLSGPMREAACMMFEPSKDADIPGGAAEVVAMKVNPATQSTATFANGDGDALVVTSVDYGAYTGQITVSIEDTDPAGDGRQITIQFEDQVETGEVDLGELVTFSYRENGSGWDTMTVAIASGVLTFAATRDQLGLDSELGTQQVSAHTVEVVSDDAGDTSTVEIWGLNGSGAAVKESIVLDGTDAVVGTVAFAKVLGARATGADGTVLVRPSAGGTTIVSIATGTTPGLKAGVVMWVANGHVTAVSSGASTKDLIVEGKSAAGATIREKITLAGVVPVTGAVDFAEITLLMLGLVEVAQTITFSATALQTNPAVQTTLLKVQDYLNAKQVEITAVTYGFICEVTTGKTAFDPENLDDTAAPEDVMYPLEPGYRADLWAVIDWINSNSLRASAEKATGATGGYPSNTTAPVFLTGGAEGTTTSADYQTALNLLKQVRVNTVVVLTPDPAVHAMLDAHCAYMCGIGRSERDGFVGLLNAGQTGLATKTEIKAQIVNLNTRHIRAVAQPIDRYNTAGERETFDPCYHAAILAGMQAGAPLATSLTHKLANVLAVSQHASWNPIDDAEEMIQAGLCFMENVDGVGRRVVRNITTYLATNNICFIEGSVNASVNYVSYEFRQDMEAAVGKRGFAGTINAAKGKAINKLGMLVSEGALTMWRALDFELVIDVLQVSVELAPVLPINFVKIINHFTTVSQTA